MQARQAIGAGFLSTLPARGATLATETIYDFLIFLSTLPARGATQTAALAAQERLISIHAPREGSDEHRRAA